MSKVKFLVDYQGVLTEERFYAAGTVIDLPTGAALVAAGRAMPVEETPPQPASAPKPRATRKRKTNA